MSTPPFVHLHCHSHYSLLDGASPIGALVERAKSLGMNALALTDHGNLHGALEFYQQAQDAGINPVIGYEAYIAPGSRLSKDAGNLKEASYHLTLLAQNRTGFKNLLKMASKAFLEGFYFKPRIDKELLEQHHEGIICLSGCVSGEFSKALLRGHGGEAELDEAKAVARWFHKLFGDRYFVEIQNNGLEIQRLAMDGAVEVARALGLPLVCTSDAHYVNREDAEAQDVLLCINTGKFRTDANRMRMEGDQFFLRSPEEMHAAFPGYEEALKQSQAIADSVAIDLELGKRHFPSYTPPEGKSSEDFLRELCLKGLKERYADNPERYTGGELAPEVMDRLERELGVISRMGFSNYFLICWDFVNYARERKIPATARGSGVGSLVCYALYLSHVCPLEYDLLFERFLDESRLEAPDIDIDFCKVRRGEVIQFVKDKYGEANVAQIGTFGTLAARAAIRDVGRALGLPIYRVDSIIAMVPDQLGIKLKDAINSEDLRKAYDNDGEVREVLDLAMKIEGLARNVGTHAAAVVIADEPLEEYVPLARVTGKTDVITQWSMNDVERAGLLKMDFLGLRNLTILSKAIELIEQTTGERVDPHKFPLDDPETYALLCRGETKGVFQLESGGIRDLLQRMKPDRFRDIIATNALYRPGPLEGGMVEDYIKVKHGLQEPVYPHPVMEEVLEETHGVMVYQEQVMRILNLLGGIQLSNAYKCIKAISKKKLETIAKFKEEFIAGAAEKGLDKQKAVELFEMIEKFAGYGFNKCVVGDTAILDAETGERTTVGELFRSGRRPKVHSLGEDGKLRARQVTDVMWNGRKEVFRLTTRQGKTITATANHPLRTFDGWTLLGDLKPGDRIAAIVADCDIYWDPIVTIEPAGVEDTYDLTVAEDHNFVADGLVVHNSHSTAYALIAYQTAYLKAHWPAEYIAALLSGDIPGRNFKKKDSLVEHLEDCKRIGIDVLPPDVTHSHADFTVERGKIRFGQAAIKGCGSSAEAIVKAREEGPFRDLFDFCERVDPQQCTRATIETLIKAGAMDCFGARRSQLLAAVERAMQAGASAIQDRRSGQKGLFDMDDGADDAPAVVLPDVPELPDKERLAMEKEVLGFYLTSHPLDEHARTLDTYTSHRCAALGDVAHRTEVMLGGALAAIKFSHTKAPRAGSTHTKYAMFDLEDTSGIMRCILWPEQFAQYSHLVEADAILVVRGKVDRRPGSEETNLIVDEMIPLADLEGRFSSGVSVRILEDRHGERGLKQLHEILRCYPGEKPLRVALWLSDGARVHLSPPTMRVDLNPEMRRRVEDLLGPENFRVAVQQTGGNGNGRR